MRNLKLVVWFIFGLICCSGELFSQSNDWLWSKKSGGTLDDDGKCVSTDINGNVYVVGSYSSSTIMFDNIVLSNSGLSDSFIVKYDSLGNVLWAKAIGAYLNERGASVTTDDLGNVYFVGEYDSPELIIGSDTLVDTVDFNMFLVKMNPDGDVIWSKSTSGQGNEYGRSIIADHSGYLYIGGDLNGILNVFDSVSFITNGDFDVFIAKYDTSGNVVWVRSYGGTSAEQVYSIVVDSSENVYLTGYFSSQNFQFNNFLQTNLGLFDIFLAKIDSLGNVSWARSFGGPNSEFATGLTTDSIGNVYISGNFYNSILVFDTINLVNAGGCEIFLAKISSQGYVEWAKSINSSGSEFSTSIKCNSSGDIYLAGRYIGNSLAIGPSALSNAGVNTSDVFIAKFDTLGNELWAFSGNDNGNSVVKSIAIDPFGNIYATGNFTGPIMTFNNYSISNSGALDMFVAKLGSTITGIDELYSKDQYIIYPNPATENFTISNKDNSLFDVSIVDANGKTVYNVKSVKSQELMVNATSFAQGVYLVRLVSSKSVCIQRLIVVN